MADTRELEIVLKARDHASDTLKAVGKTATGLADTFKRNFNEAGLLAGGMIGAFGALTQSAVANAASYEQNRIAFESMLGSADKARSLLQQVSDFAQKTPFELPQVVEGAKRLLAYNVEAKNIIPTFKMLGDIASGVGTDKLPQLITAFGQVQAKGKLMGTELLQFTEAGVGLLDALVKKANENGGMLVSVTTGTKKTAGEVEKLNTNLAITKKQLDEATASGKAKESTLMRLRARVADYEGKLSEASAGQQTFSKRVKVTREEMQDMISDGQITAQQVEEALKGMTEKGGLFFEGMERQSKSFNGVLSNTADAFGKFVREVVGISAQGDIRDGSLFAALKVGAERFLVVLEDLRPRVTAFVNALSQNKDVLVGLAGAMGGLVVLALGALVTAIGPALAVMTAVAAVGAGLALLFTHIDEIFRQLAPSIAGVTSVIFLLNGAFKGLWVTIAAHPIGALITAAALLALGITYLATQTDTFKTKNDLLKESLDRLKQSTDEVAGAQERLKDVYLRLEGSELAVERAQRNLDSVVKQYGATSLEAKEAQHQLNQAHREQERSILDAKKALEAADEAEKKYRKDVASYKQTVDANATSWERVSGAIGGAINKLVEWNDKAMRFGVGVGQLKLPGFATGGWVKQTGPAIVHQGEFVLSRDMLAGRQPIPSTVMNSNNRNATISVGPVYVQGMADVDSLTQRLGFHFQTAGNL